MDEASGFGVEGVGFGDRNMKTLRNTFRRRGSGFGLWVPGSGFRVLGSGIRDPGSEIRVPGSGIQVSGSGFCVSCFGFRVPCFGFPVPGVWCQLFGIRGQGLRLYNIHNMGVPRRGTGQAGRSCRRFPRASASGTSSVCFRGTI